MINVALPKGRLGERAYEAFASAGYDCPEILEKNRRLTFENREEGGFRVTARILLGEGQNHG